MTEHGKFCYGHPRPALTVDVVLLQRTSEGHQVLLIQRGHPPYRGDWALPGGFVDEGEAPETAARRELAEETSVAVDAPLVQVGAFGTPGRDPRGWVVSIAYAAVGTWDPAAAVAADDAADTAWWAVTALPELAFDHREIIQVALRQLGLADR